MGNVTFILLYSKSQTPPPGATDFDSIQTVAVWSLQAGNIKGLWKILIESEKNNKILEKH